MNLGSWFRIESSGNRSVWWYCHGPTFRIEVTGAGHLSRYAWHMAEDGRELDCGHFATAEGIRGFIHYCWRRHLRGLTGHEMLDYIQLGLVTEDELHRAADEPPGGRS
jgi:hypothetical protein